MTQPIESELKEQATELVEEQLALEAKRTALMEDNPQLAELLIQEKSFQDKSALMWESIFQSMKKHDIKTIKGDWGYITVAERRNFKADLEELPAKFLKKEADKKKIGSYFDLTGKLPKGVTTSVTQYLTKKIKSGDQE